MLESFANDKAMAGTFVALLKQSIIGVTSGHSRVVIVTGTGSNIKVAQDRLVMKLGKSHPIEKLIPQGISCAIESSDIRQTRLRINGIDEQKVGQFASELRIRRAYAGGIHAWVEGDISMIKKRKGGK
jgi:large subunit ribosomal protein L6